MWNHFVVGTFLLGAVNGAFGGMIDKEGMKPWEICGLCHSLDGVSAMPKFPILAGQKADYMVKQMKDFRTGRRQNDGGQMAAIVTEVKPEDDILIAEYFSSLPMRERQVDADEYNTEEYQQGKVLFYQGVTGRVPKCAGCHNNERGSAPELRSQHARYLKKQLQDFKTGARMNNEMMKGISRNLSQDEIDALVTFLSLTVREKKFIQ